MAMMSNRKVCVFCENSEQKINYKEFKLLRKFITDQGKIIPAHVTGVCSKHQRQLTREIKRARNIGFLPYTYDIRHH